MKRCAILFLPILVCGRLLAAGQCEPHQMAIIDSEARCVEEGGINIGYNGDDGVKVACMESKQVRSLCGPDGQLTRLRAYSAWYNRLKHFEDACAHEGGTFSFQDATFTEPQNESYCLQATPEVGSNMFEEPLCNYRSVCPAITVVCDHSCTEAPVARL